MARSRKPISVSSQPPAVKATHHSRFRDGYLGGGCQDILGKYGAHKVVQISADGAELASSPDLKARALAAAVDNYSLDALLGLASAQGRDIFARLAAFKDLPLASDCLGGPDRQNSCQIPFFRQDLRHHQDDRHPFCWPPFDPTPLMGWKHGSRTIGGVLFGRGSGPGTAESPGSAKGILG